VSRAALFLAALCAGCSVPLDAPLDQTTVNTCDAASDCGGGAACEAGKCVATSYDLGGLLLAVRPSADAIFAANTSYVVDPSPTVTLVSPGAGGSPFLTGFDVKLPLPVSIQHGEVVLDGSIPLPQGCVLAHRSVPASLTFFRVPRFAGLPADIVSATTTTAPAEDGSYPFDVDLVSDASDTYDVYIAPLPVSGCPAFPPSFLASQAITTGGAVSWTLPPAGTLTGTIAGLTDVTAWQVDVLEWTRGQVISTGTTLTLDAAATGAVVTAQVAWSDPTKPPILRLQPIAATAGGTSPDVALARPTVFWTLQGAVFSGTDVDPTVNFTVDDLPVDPATVTGQIVGGTVTAGVMAQLTVQSLTLQGTNAGNAAFSTTTTTDAQGNFTVHLPAGEYAVRAIPLSDDSRSITDFMLQSPMAASMPPLQLDPKGTLVGTITTTMGTSLGATPVDVTPSQQLARSYLADTHTLGPVATRVASITTDGIGRFSLSLDRGSSDLVVQPDPSTNLPWLIRPQVTVATASTLVVTAPAFLGGTLLAPDGTPVADAQIDAWFPVRDPSVAGGRTGTVIKIATTSTDQNGAYTLVLPSSVGPAGASL